MTGVEANKGGGGGGTRVEWGDGGAGLVQSSTQYFEASLESADKALKEQG